MSTKDRPEYVFVIQYFLKLWLFDLLKSTEWNNKIIKIHL